jgi:hypothetical protein
MKYKILSVNIFYINVIRILFVELQEYIFSSFFHKAHHICENIVSSVIIDMKRATSSAMNEKLAILVPFPIPTQNAKNTCTCTGYNIYVKVAHFYVKLEVGGHLY